MIHSSEYKAKIKVRGFWPPIFGDRHSLAVAVAKYDLLVGDLQGMHGHAWRNVLRHAYRHAHKGGVPARVRTCPTRAIGDADTRRQIVEKAWPACMITCADMRTHTRADAHEKRKGKQTGP